MQEILCYYVSLIKKWLQAIAVVVVTSSNSTITSNAKNKTGRG